jgi:hypothetical protein
MQNFSKRTQIFLLFIFITFIGIFIYLYSKLTRANKAIVQKDLNIKKLVALFSILHEDQDYWKKIYNNKEQWLKNYQQIPNPSDAILDIIDSLNKLEVNFRAINKTSFADEIQASIHALKGGILELSFANLMKVIENLLAEELMINDKFKLKYKTEIERGKYLNLGKFIEFSKENGLLVSDSKFLSSAKKIRNKLIHEVSPEIEPKLLIDYHHKIIGVIQEIGGSTN